MKPLNCLLTGALALLAACSPNDSNYAMRQTSFPGMVTAGGGTSGEVMARAKTPQTAGSTAGGTPYHAGGADGNTGGAATAGTTAQPAAKPAPSGQ